MNKPITILVVEDEPLLRMDAVEALSDRGFAILEASNAIEAIAMLSSHPEIRVVFTDVDMPGSMDGLMLAAAVRDRWPPVKIIITSGHRLVGNLPQGSRFLKKPYKTSVVAAAVLEMAA